jgi:ERCC4-type nuclease
MTGSTQIHVLIDHREHAIIEHVQDIITNNGSSGIQVATANLDCGDVHFCIDASSDGGQKLAIVFERKTIADLVASIKDGRYREQKLRLISYMAEKECTASYIIEGDHHFALDGTDQCIQGVSCKAITGVFVNTTFRDGIPVVHTQDARDTACFIASLATRMLKDPTAYVLNKRGVDDTAYTHANIQARRTKRMGPEHIFATQLSVIPGVSASMGTKLAAHFKSMSKLVVAMSELPNTAARSRSLQAFPLLGKKMATNILESIGLQEA